MQGSCLRPREQGNGSTGLITHTGKGTMNNLAGSSLCRRQRRLGSRLPKREFLITKSVRTANFLFQFWNIERSAPFNSSQIRKLETNIIDNGDANPTSYEYKSTFGKNKSNNQFGPSIEFCSFGSNADRDTMSSYMKTEPVPGPGAYDNKNLINRNGLAETASFAT